MAEWNLSVELRGQGTSLARTLRQNAGHARNLADAVDDAQNNIRTLGQTSETASDKVKTLGGASRAAQRRLERMAAQVRDAARDMRDLARAAAQADAQLRATVNDVRIAVTLDDQTGRGTTAIRNALDDLERRSPLRLSATFDGDPAQITATAAAIRDLRDDAQRVSAAFAGLSPDTATAAAALNTVQNAAGDTSRALLLLRRRALAAADAFDELRDRALLAAGRLHLLGGAAVTASGHLNRLSGDTRTLRGDMSDLDGTLQQIIARITAVNGTLGPLTNSTQNAADGSNHLRDAAIALATALIPVAAAAVPIAASLAAAGAGAAAFGVAVGGQIAVMAEASEAQKKYDEAVEEHGRTSSEAVEAEAAYLRQVKKMPAATREAAAGFSALKDDYQEWSDSLADDTMPAFTKGFATLRAMLPTVTPIVQGAGDEMERLATIAGGVVASPGFDAFMKRVATWSTDALHSGTSQLIALSRAADGFSESSGFSSFMDYARQNGPLVADTLKNLTSALGNILEGAADVGVSMLTLVNAFARMVNALPPAFIGTVLQLAIAFKAAQMAAAALAAVTGASAVAGLAAFVRAAQFGGVASAIAGVAQRMSGLQKAALGLGVLAVVGLGISHLAKKARGAPPDVDKLTASLKRLADTGKFTGELKATFGDMDGLIKKAQKLTEETNKANQTAFGFRVPVLDDTADWIATKISDITKGGDSLTALQEDFTGLDASMAQLASSGYADKAATDMALIRSWLKKTGRSTEEITAMFPQYGEAVAGVKYEQELAAQSMGLFGTQAQSTGKKLDEQKASADGLRQAIQALNDVNRASLGGMIGFEAAIDAATAAAKENAGSLNMVNGELDLNSPKAQAAATALADLGLKTDEAAAAAREAGQPWEYVNGIYERGEAALIKTAMAMGLTKGEAKQLAAEILSIPDKEMRLEMRTEDAITGLDSVIKKIKDTPGAKSVTVKALTAEAVQTLRDLGFKVTRLKDGRFKVAAETGAARSGLAALQRQRDALEDKTITLLTRRHYINLTENRTIYTGKGGRGPNAYADGGIQQGSVRYFAEGSERHVAQIAPAGSMRVWAEPETGGEAYIPLASSKRVRSRAIADETVRRLGGSPVQWMANGDVTDWRYDPQNGSLYSSSDAGQAGRKTRKVKTKKGTKEINYFSLSAVESKLKSTAKATRAWNADLGRVADRVGGDVAEALAAMGKDGVALTKKMAHGSTKYINQMASALRDLAKTARASLSDYTRQINKATALDSTFAKNLATLAGRGYGDLAKQLAAQNDTAASELAASAVKDSRKARGANTAAKKANNALTSEQVQQLVAIIASITTSKTGLHQVADRTGLGEDDIIATANRAGSQIKSALGSRAGQFLADLGRANKGLAYANGGIREGIYATHGGLVRFAEPSTGGEAYIPLAASKRANASRVLADVAGRFGVGLTDAGQGGRVVVVREQGPLVGQQTWHIGGGNSPRETAREIERRDAYQLRRLARGGVGTR